MLRSFFGSISKNASFLQHQRAILMSPVTRLKEIIEKKEGNTLTIEARIYSDPQEHKLIKSENGACILCSAGIDIKHTDVLILSQYVRSDGRILPRRITGLCKIQQKRVQTMILMAHRAGLMPNLGNNRRETRRNYKQFKTYFEESTIRYKYHNYSTRL